MANPDPIDTAITELLAERARIDEDIADLERIKARRAGLTPLSPPPTVASSSTNGAAPSRRPAALPGEARTEILELLSDGKTWTPGEIAKRRGTSPNAASRALKRMLNESPPQIRSLGGARYRIASPKGDAQGSLSVDAEGR